MTQHPKSGQFLLSVTNWTILAIALPVLLLTLGCSSAPSPIANPIEIDTTEYDRIFQASAQVLRDNGFRVDRHDYRFGVMNTYPKASPTLVEPWHSDNITLGQAAQSTTNFQRRRIEIRLTPVEPTVTQTDDTPAADEAATTSNSTTPDASYMLQATVTIEQVEAPRRFLTGSTAPGRMFRNYRAMPAELTQLDIQSNYWRPVGRDTALEQQLVADILRQSVQIARSRPWQSSPATP